MILTIFGWIFCGFAVLLFASMLMVLHGEASDPQGGGGAPTMTGVIFPPIFFAFGLGLLDKRYSDFALPGWAYLGIWLGGTILIYALHEIVWRVVHSKARKKLEKHDHAD